MEDWFVDIGLNLGEPTAKGPTLRKMKKTISKAETVKFFAMDKIQQSSHSVKEMQ